MVGCAKDKTTDTPVDSPHVNEVNLIPYFENQRIYLDSVYTFSDGVKVQLVELKCYFQGFMTGTTQIFEYALYDYRAKGTRVYSGAGPLPTADILTFGVGVDAANNHSDPSTWPNNHPLNIAVSNDMHWDWNPGYIFFKVEAKVDTIPDQTLALNHNLVYHVGTDNFFSQKSITGASWVASSNKHQLNLKFNLKEFFKPVGDEINFTNESSTHSASGQEVVTEKIRLHFINALTLE